MSWNNRGGLAHNPPFVVPVQIDPRLNEYIPLFTGYVLDYVTATATKNQARALFQQLLEQDQNALQSVVQELADVVLYYVDSENQGPGQVEYTIKNVVGPVVDAYLGMAVNTYPQQFANAVDQTMAHEAQRYVQELEQVRFQAQRFYTGNVQNQQWGNNQQRGWQPQQRGGYVRGGGRPTTGTRFGGGGNTRWDEPIPDQGSFNGSYRTAAQDNWPGNNVGGFNRGQQRQGGGNTIWDESPARTTRRGSDESFNGGGNVRPRREFHHQPTATAPARQETRPVTHQAPASVPSGAQVVEGQTFVPAGGDKLWPKVANTNRLFDWILLEDGTQMRPAYQSSWQPTWAIDRPAAPYYDPTTHILFHIKDPNGVVTAKPLKREPAMDYLDHELDPDLRLKARDKAAQGQNVAPAWQLVEQLRPNPDTPLATAEPLNDDVDGMEVERPEVPSSFLVNSQLTDAVKRACMRLKVDKPELLKQAFEIYVERTVLTDVVNPNFEDLEKLSKIDNYRAMHKELLELPLEQDLADEIDRRMTLGLNQALKEHMGLASWEIESFREDYGDLVALLEKKFSKQAVELLESNAAEIIYRYLNYYSQEDLPEVEKSVGLEAGQVALVWCELCSVTRVPLTSTALALPADTGMLVTEGADPKIYKTLRSIFQRTEDFPQMYYGRYLLCEDGVVYSLVRGYFNDESILVYKADFTIQ